MAAVSVEEAFAYCEARTKAHYENFPVGLFVPRKRRPYVYALYAFARAADDFADEPIYEGMRREKLDEWERLLDAAYRGEAEGPIFVALGETVRRLGIPKQLLLDLLSAFRQDVDEDALRLVGGAARLLPAFGEPVGRLVLLVFEQPGEDLPALSDAICTGLQLANHWQDAAIDYARGPDLRPAKSCCAGTASASGTFAAGRVSDGLRGLMGELISRTRELFERGRPLCDRVGARAALRDAPDLARRILDPRPHRGGGLRRLRAPAEARDARQGGAGLAGLALERTMTREPSAPGSPARAAPTSTTPSGSCRRRSAAPSMRSTRSAAWSTTASTRRTASARRGSTAGWRRSHALLRRASPTTELGRELAETVARFPIPRACFEDIVAGCRMDLTVRRYATWAELRAYCERVASAVGLASIEIFGYEDPGARATTRSSSGWRCSSRTSSATSPATLERGRLYLPLEDLARFCVSEAALAEAAHNPGGPRPAGLSELMAFEAQRALSHYAAAAAHLPRRDRRSLLSAEIMGSVYRALLEELLRLRLPVGGPRVSLGKPRKAWVALRTVARVYWGP